jgi:ADP-ribosyl-[dinitrogen reductase] hydrolase
VARIDQDKARGAMLGLAVGDWLGGRGAGVTELALRLATTLTESGGYDPDRALGHYVAWMRTEPEAASPHMREVLGAIAGGTDSFRATSSFHLGGGDTSGNEAVVRATPIGIAFAGREEPLRDATLSDAALTHFDPLAGKVALLHNQIVGWLVTDGPERFVAELRNPEWLDDRIEDVVIPAASGVRGFAEKLATSQPGSALTSLAIALVAVYNADNFEEGLEWAVNLGGDADGDGAVTGALLGARLGASAIPAHWLDTLTRRAEIDALSEQLAALAG